MKNYDVAVLPGDGIGPEVVNQAIRVLKELEKKNDFKFHFEFADVGGIAIDNHEHALPQSTIEVCEKSQAILFGSVGGPKWENLPSEQQPERAALLPLRKHFDLFANFRPAIVYENMLDMSPIKNEILKGGLDILIIRELTSGIYFGSPKKIEQDKAFDTLVYHKHEIERIARVAFESAKKRNNKVTSIDKANVLSSMVFWRKTVEKVAKGYPEVELNHMYVDNAAMQMIRNPKQFDVLLCGNMFGDILSDEASMLTGSLGMLPSASVSQGNFGLYEPIGGTAPDIAGKDMANPIAQILSASMMLTYSFNEIEAAKSIQNAIMQALKVCRTGDIPQDGLATVGTTAITDEIIKNL